LLTEFLWCCTDSGDWRSSFINPVVGSLGQFVDCVHGWDGFADVVGIDLTLGSQPRRVDLAKRSADGQIATHFSEVRGKRLDNGGMVKNPFSESVKVYQAGGMSGSEQALIAGPGSLNK
jgi:hypothetical protein